MNNSLIMEYLWVSAFLVLLSTISDSKINQKSRLLPMFLNVCYRDDHNLNLCARDSFKSLESRLLDGIPELFLPPMEPLIIPEIKLDQDSGAIYLHSLYKNVKISGISNYTLNDLKIVPSKLKFFVLLSFPHLQMESDYNIKGKIMMMPLLGDGRCNINLTNVTLQTELSGQEYKKHGEIYLKITDIKIEYTLGHVSIKLENLFNGDKILGQRMNDFLNENWRSLAEEVRPLLTKALLDILRASIDKIFNTFSYDQLLPKRK